MISLLFREWINHENYEQIVDGKDLKSIIFDYSIIWLLKSVAFDKPEIGPICLPNPNTKYSVTAYIPLQNRPKAQFAGWGARKKESRNPWTVFQSWSNYMMGFPIMSPILQKVSYFIYRVSQKKRSFDFGPVGPVLKTTFSQLSFEHKKKSIPFQKENALLTLDQLDQF